MTDRIMSSEEFRLLALKTAENFTSAFKHHASPLYKEIQSVASALQEETPKAIQVARAVIEGRPWLIISTFVVVYLSFVQLLRFRNLRNINKKYAAYIQDPYKLDYKTAHPIMKHVMLSEAPWMYGFSTQMALVKTYAVAPGTGLLVATRQLTQESTVGRRAEDTGVILTEFIVGELDSERGMKALSKMNWLHRRYGNKIRRPEMLHTLAMFVLEPMRWFELYEWRPMSNLEKVAIYTYWKEIGSRMGMADIPETLEDLEEWTEAYAKENMYYTDDNKACAEATIGLFIRSLPKFMQEFAKQAAISLFEDYVRVALGYEKPPAYIANIVYGIFKARQFIMRHLLLPRFTPLDPLPKLDDKNRLHRTMWAFEPWYVKASLSERLKAWFATGGEVIPGPKYKSDGIFIEDLGPVKYENVSREGVLMEADQMQEYAEGGGAVGQGCPFKVHL